LILLFLKKFEKFVKEIEIFNTFEVLDEVEILKGIEILTRFSSNREKMKIQNPVEKLYKLYQFLYQNIKKVSSELNCSIFIENILRILKNYLSETKINEEIFSSIVYSFNVEVLTGILSQFFQTFMEKSEDSDIIESYIYKILKIIKLFLLKTNLNEDFFMKSIVMLLKVPKVIKDLIKFEYKTIDKTEDTKVDQNIIKKIKILNSKIIEESKDKILKIFNIQIKILRIVNKISTEKPKFIELLKNDRFISKIQCVFLYISFIFYNEENSKNSLEYLINQNEFFKNDLVSDISINDTKINIQQKEENKNILHFLLVFNDLTKNIFKEEENEEKTLVSNIFEMFVFDEKMKESITNSFLIQFLFDKNSYIQIYVFNYVLKNIKNLSDFKFDFIKILFENNLFYKFEINKMNDMDEIYIKKFKLMNKVTVYFLKNLIECSKKNFIELGYLMSLIKKKNLFENNMKFLLEIIIVFENLLTQKYTIYMETIIKENYEIILFYLNKYLILTSENKNSEKDNYIMKNLIDKLLLIVKFIISNYIEISYIDKNIMKLILYLVFEFNNGLYDEYGFLFLHKLLNTKNSIIFHHFFYNLNDQNIVPFEKFNRIFDIFVNIFENYKFYEENQFNISFIINFLYSINLLNICDEKNEILISKNKNTINLTKKNHKIIVDDFLKRILNFFNNLFESNDPNSGIINPIIKRIIL
jgi:hypothetical protein